MILKNTFVLLMFLLVGCSTNDRYDWGNTQNELLSLSLNSSSNEDAITLLVNHLNKAEGSEKKVAPGLYAELGTLYYQNGEYKNALHYYQKERVTWPESAIFMDKLISNIKDM